MRGTHCSDCGAQTHILVVGQRVVRDVCVPCRVRKVAEEEERTRRIADGSAKATKAFFDSEEWR